MSGPIIHVLGPQGSGKGTQIQLLKAQYQMPSVSAGELFRATSLETELGRRVHGLIDHGNLVTIDLWKAVVVEYLTTADFSRGYLLDGVVRTLEQNAYLEPLLASRSLPSPWVLSITLDDDVAVKRLVLRASQEGRVDDTEAGIRSRLAWSRNEVQPVVEYFRSRSRVIEVNGDQTVDAVHRDIVTALVNAGVVSEPPQ